MTEETKGRKGLHWFTVSEGSVYHNKASWMMGVTPSTKAGIYCRACHTAARPESRDYAGSGAGL